MMTNVSHPDTRVHIELPLPLDVAGTLISAIGQLYPNTVIDQTTSSTKMTLVITEDDRNRQDIHLTDLEVEPAINVGDESHITSWDEVGPHMSTPDNLSAELGRIGSALLEHTDAENYVEVQVRNPAGERLLITAVKTEAQDPRKLHLAAQATVERLADALLEIQDRLSCNEGLDSIGEVVTAMSDTLSTIKACRQPPVDTAEQAPDPLDELA